MGTRRRARELALQVLYQIELSELPADTAFELFCENFQAGKKSKPYARELVLGVTSNWDKVNKLITRHAKNWRPQRMSMVDRNILRVAVFEICCRNEVPASVSINEAIEIAKRFGTEDSGPFINGILDAINKFNDGLV